VPVPGRVREPFAHRWQAKCLHFNGLPDLSSRI